MIDHKQLAFWAIFGTILVGTSLAGTEFLASFYVPSWPARVLNPRAPAPERHLGAPYKNQPWMADGDNSWAIRHQERTVAKPAGTRRAERLGSGYHGGMALPPPARRAASWRFAGTS